MNAQVTAPNAQAVKRKLETNNQEKKCLKSPPEIGALAAKAQSGEGQKTNSGEARMNRLSLISKLANLAPKAAVLAIFLLALLAASQRSFAQCAQWVPPTILVHPGDKYFANYGGSVVLTSPGFYPYTWDESGDLDLQGSLVVYFNRFPVPKSGSFFFNLFGNELGLTAKIPSTATNGQTKTLTFAIDNCRTSVRLKVEAFKSSPALSTEMNTIGGNNQVDEYYKGTDLNTDLNIYQLLWPGTWKYANVTALAQAPHLDALSPIASQVDAPHNRSEVFYLDANQNVEEIYYDNVSTWGHANLTSLAKAPPAKAGSPLVCLVNQYANSIQVDYLDSAGHIHELYSWDRTTWGGSDITNTAGAPPAASDSPLLTLDDTRVGQVEVYYLDANHFVRGLKYWSAPNGWAAFNPTPNGAPAAAAGSSLVGLVNPYANTVQVDYLDSTGDVRELFSQDRTTWAGGNLRVATNAPKAAAGSALATHVNTLAGSVELYYFDSDWKPNELWWNSSSGWHSADPTYLTGAVNAAPHSPVVSLVNTRANTVQVHYIGADKHVHELWWGGTWNAGDVTNGAKSPDAVP